MEAEENKHTLEELKELLNDKQKIFCHEYVIEWNGSKSYKKAYPNVIDDTARVNASKLLTNTNINQYIDFIKNDYEKECGISKIKQIREYSKIAYSSISNLHNTWIDLKEFESLTDEQKEAIESIDTRIEQKAQYNPDTEGKELIEVKQVKIKLYSKLAALERIDKLMGYNEAEKHEHSGEIKGTSHQHTYEELYMLKYGKKPE